MYTILLSYDWNDPLEQGLQVQIDSSNIQNGKKGNWDWRCKEDILINAKRYATKKAIRDERKAILWMKGYTTYLWKETHCDCLCSGSDSGEKNFGLVLSRRLHSDWIDCFMFYGFVKWGFVLPFLRAPSGLSLTPRSSLDISIDIRPLQEWGLNQLWKASTWSQRSWTFGMTSP